jgi:AcrR family transcriptional regulator
MTLESEMRKAEAMSDPLRRALFVEGELIPLVEQTRARILELRAKAVYDAWNEGNGMVYRDIAKALGVSKPLVQQMIAYARQLRESKEFDTE